MLQVEGMAHSLRRLTAAEQTADHLREGIRDGRWPEKLPGVLALAAECDVSPATMRAAIRQLEEEGWIRGSGAGKARTAGEGWQVRSAALAADHGAARHATGG